VIFGEALVCKRVTAAKVIVLIGYLMTLTGAVADKRFDLSDLRALGIATILAGALWVGIDFYQSVRQAGYDDGWDECRSTLFQASVVRLEDKRKISS
jgi:hypothetical protein